MPVIHHHATNPSACPMKAQNLSTNWSKTTRNTISLSHKHLLFLQRLEFPREGWAVRAKTMYEALLEFRPKVGLSVNIQIGKGYL